MQQTIVHTRVIIYILSFLTISMIAGYVFLESVVNFFGMKFAFHEEKIEKNSTGTLIEELVEEPALVIPAYDLITDSSYTKFVNPDVSFQDVSYVPASMVAITSEFVTDTKGNGQMRVEANNALQEMAADFHEFFGIKLKVVSSYRSYNYQKGIKDRGCPDNLCAKAGYSEHQGGLAVDFFSASTQATWLANPKYSSYYTWMKLKASDYGFHNTYQKGLEIDGYEIEPWHWRYLGEELAKYLEENDMTIAEYYNEEKAK